MRSGSRRFFPRRDRIVTPSPARRIDADQAAGKTGAQLRSGLRDLASEDVLELVGDEAHPFKIERVFMA